MAIGGFSSYGQIMANRPQQGFGSFRDGMNTGQDMTDFFRKQKLRDELGNAETGIYSNNMELDPGVAEEASAFARVGDFESAQAVLDRDRKAKEHALNMQLRADANAERAENNRWNQQMRQDALNDKRDLAREKAAVQAESEENMRSAAVSALRELRDLGQSGDITNMNKSTDNWLLSGKSSRNLGRRTAALSALLPMTNAIARASGGSGINTLGEMMAYLGLPENATSAQIEGARTGLMQRLGISESELDFNYPGTSSGNYRNTSQGASIDELDRIAMGQ